ncbi:MAG: cobalamin biosynthesis protein [Paenibacillus sp.]|jgi:G3E family GTPase|nr:cobalamin biosynthesis protein [Paenibacillus sp.]
MNKTPIFILSGFLGSGKTTLLAKLLAEMASEGLRPAVVMNEVGDINLDGHLLSDGVPMRDMLSGCICCTIRGDLAVEIQQLITESSPDVIFVEATGVANPMEILDAVSEAAPMVHIDVRAMITVVDASHYLKWARRGTGRTYHLMADQIRCASIIILNKQDLIVSSEYFEIKQSIHSLNPLATVMPAVQCEVNMEWIRQFVLQDTFKPAKGTFPKKGHGGHNHHDHDQHHNHEHHHHSYDHIMVYTHYFTKSIEEKSLERLIQELPDLVYRAKGIFTNAENGDRILFQFAFRQLDLIKIKPQGFVQDVAIFMGEQFSKPDLQDRLAKIEENSLLG